MDVTSRKMTQPLPAMGLNVLRVKFFLLERFPERNEILRIFQTSIESSKRSEWLGSKIIVDDLEIRNELFSRVIESILHRIL